MRILVTGSREWTDRGVILRALEDAVRGHEGQTVTLVHGNARGADKMAVWAVGARAWPVVWVVEPHRADWRRFGNAAGMIRNHEMVMLGADVCLGFPLGVSRGTRGCLKMAVEEGIRVVSYEGGLPVVLSSRNP